jgi:hypothetical protein
VIDIPAGQLFLGDVIGGLDKREFMLREPGGEAPALFTTRWAMSYLRGPLTREQIWTLMQDRHTPSARTAEGSAPGPATDGPAPTGGDAAAETVPVAPTVAAPQAPPSGPDRDQVTLQTRYEGRIGKAQDANGAARERVAQAQAAENTRRQSDIVAGAGGLLGAVLGGRRSACTMARDLRRVLTGQARRAEAAQRVRGAENRAAERREAMAKPEADLARDLAAIDDEWAAKADAVESVEVPLERSDIRITARSLVWIPVG